MPSPSLLSPPPSSWYAVLFITFNHLLYPTFIQTIVSTRRNDWSALTLFLLLLS